MRIHELKTWPEYFEAMARGEKLFEIRNDDRGFIVGDLLHLREYVPGTGDYTRRDMWVIVTRLWLDVPGVKPGHVVLGIAPANHGLIPTHLR